MHSPLIMDVLAYLDAYRTRWWGEGSPSAARILRAYESMCRGTTAAVITSAYEGLSALATLHALRGWPLDETAHSLLEERVLAALQQWRKTDPLTRFGERERHG